MNRSKAIEHLKFQLKWYEGQVGGQININLDVVKESLLVLEKKENDRKEGAIEQKEKDKIVFVKFESTKFKNRVRIVFADGTIQFFDL